MADTDSTTRARDQLTEERDAVAAQLAEVDADEEERTYDEGHADSSQVTAEKGEARSQAEHLRVQVRELDRALAKIEGGEAAEALDVDTPYGACEVCGTDIAGPRLEAMPATRYCIDHA